MNENITYTAYVAAEECNEVAQAIMKTLRFGLMQSNPNTGETNKEMLETEIGQLIYSLQKLSDELDLDKEAINHNFSLKKTTWGKWKFYYDNRL